MIEIRLATLVVIWFPRYLLTNKSMLDLKSLHALGIATNMIIFRQLHFFIAFWYICFDFNYIWWDVTYRSSTVQPISPGLRKKSPLKMSIFLLIKKLWSLKFYYLTFYYFLLPTTFLLRIDIFISIASRILMTGQTCVLIVLMVHF